MERFFEFIQNHPVLAGIFLGCLIAYVVLESKRSGRKVSPQQLGIMVNNENAKIVDLRDQKDFQDGHISGSENIGFSKLDAEIERLKALNIPIIFVCKMGTHASGAVQKIGADNAYRLAGGILGWTGDGLPLIKSKKSKKK